MDDRISAVRRCLDRCLLLLQNQVSTLKPIQSHYIEIFLPTPSNAVNLFSSRSFLASCLIPLTHLSSSCRRPLRQYRNPPRPNAPLHYTGQCLIPHPNLTLRPRRKHLTRLLFRPSHTVDGSTTRVRVDLVVHLARLPVPEADVSAGIARSNELPVGTADQPDAGAGGVVAAPGLLAVLAELVRGRRVGDDGVVGALVEDVFA